MKLFLPENVFTKVISKDLSGFKIDFIPASLVIQRLKENPDSVGFIPVTDLINNRNLFVSKTNGISFEGSLCNTYIYYSSMDKGAGHPEKENKYKELNLFGDISTVEIILSKILFKELYNTEAEIKISKDINGVKNENLVITGYENFKDEKFKKGISFSETIADTLNIPYVNYIIASVNKEAVESANKNFQGISAAIYNKIEKGNFDSNLSEAAEQYIMENISSLIMDFQDDDIEGINQLIRLPYYHGIIDDIFDINFV